MASGAKIVGGKKLKLALDAIEKKITQGGVLRVGFLEGATYPERTNARFLAAVGSNATPTVQPQVSVAQVAFWNEYGTKTAPARPFFRTTIRLGSDRWAAILAHAIPHFDYDGEKALRLLGQSMRDDIESAIAQWSEPGNAPLTIKIKGFDSPLKDSGQMQRDVDFEVVKA
jgi:hypothetical protein